MTGERGWIARVVVTPKPGVNDPEGEAILGGLRSLGHHGVQRVRAGRYLEVDLVARDGDSARAEADEMCRQLLANPVIEAFRVTIEEDGMKESRTGST